MNTEIVLGIGMFTVTVVVLAVIIPQVAARVRGVLAGVCIALASPGLLLTWVAIDVGQALSGTFLGRLAQGSVGIGAFALLLGFLCALISAFVMLWHSHGTADGGEEEA